MRVFLILLLALAAAASAAYVEKGCLTFQLINSTAGLEGRFLLYIYQPLCEECKKNRTTGIWRLRSCASPFWL